MRKTVVSACLVLSVQNSLYAQETTHEVNANDVEKITVTATRTEKSFSSINAGISIIETELLRNINAQHIHQLVINVPGAWVSRGNGQEHLTAIRSPVLTGAGGCGAFFIALDGISSRAPGFCNANQLFDLNSEQAERIEVLRGPSSTLYGSNALHGVINVITPSADAIEQQLELTLGAYDYTRLETDNSVESEWGNVRLLANFTHDGGYQTESGFDQQKATLIFEPTMQTWSNKTVLDIANLNQETAGFIQGFELYRDEDARRINPNPEAFRDAKSLRFYSKFSKDGLSITPYLRWNDMTFLQHFLPWQAQEDNGHESIGIQVQQVFERFGAQFISGLDVDFTSAELQEFQAEPFSPTIPQGDHYDYDVDALQIAGFIRGDWQWDRLGFSVGARIETLDYDYDNLLSDGSACAPEVTLCRFSRPQDQSRDFTYVSPSAELSYELTDSVRVFSKVSRGLRAPQATELFRLQNNQSIADIQEESMDAIEIGGVYTGYDHQFRVNLYSMEKEDVIIRDTQRQVIVGGDTSHEGLEVEWQWQLNDKLDLFAAATFQRHEYDNDIAISRQSINGNRIDTAPDTMGSMRLNYQASDKLQGSIAWQHMSDYILNPENTAEYEGHDLVDLEIRYAVNSNLDIAANVFNLFDEDYAERADFAFGNYRYFVGQPRRLFVRVSYRY